MLVARYQQPMLRLACSMVSNQAVAEEAVQDTWLGVVRGIEQFEGRSSFKTWLFRILVNRARSAAAHEPSDPSIDTLRAVDPTRFDAQGQWADPLDRWTEESEARLTPPPGCRSSNLPSMNCLPVSARSSCCEMSKAFPTTKRAPCSESVLATSGSCCTGGARDCERSSTPRWRRADRAIAATERHRVPAGGRTRHRLSRRGSLPAGPTPI